MVRFCVSYFVFLFVCVCLQCVSQVIPKSVNVYNYINVHLKLIK